MSKLVGGGGGNVTEIVEVLAKRVGMVREKVIEDTIGLTQS